MPRDWEIAAVRSVARIVATLSLVTGFSSVRKTPPMEQSITNRFHIVRGLPQP